MKSQEFLNQTTEGEVICQRCKEKPAVHGNLCGSCFHEVSGDKELTRTETHGTERANRWKPSPGKRTEAQLPRH
ncbi:hypothetical protein KJ840_04060 [Patescibacteria group bacterium]|nr:hypothetical protein [Patescibacteria group bacterium]